MRTRIRGAIAALSLAAGIMSAVAVGQGGVGTAFTYQGQLKQSGAPVSGASDLKFSLWRDPSKCPSDCLGDGRGDVET